MKTLNIITLFVSLSLPLSIRANPVEGISDLNGSFRGVERIDFDCPPNEVKKIRRSNEELADQQKKMCWVDFYPTFLNVMDQQVINRHDVIRFFQAPPASGKCCASWNLIYRDKENKTKMLSIRRNVLPFPLTKRKLKKLGTPANTINRWLAQ